jgi:hypothetical protein
METASTSKEEDSARATYARGYQPLLQEDPEISVTHGPRNTVPEQPVVMQTLPPYTPEQQSSQYTPAPQSFNPPQQSSSNVVVVNQPSASQPTVVEVEPNDHLIFAVISFIICCLLGNWFAIIFLIPAFFLSQMASNANNSGNYVKGRRLAKISFAFIMFTYIAFITTFIIVIGTAVIMAVIITVANE